MNDPSELRSWARIFSLPADRAKGRLLTEAAAYIEAGRTNPQLATELMTWSLMASRIQDQRAFSGLLYRTAEALATPSPPPPE